MPNTFAYGALLIWPLVTFAIFAILRPNQAVIWSLLAGYLFLPVKTSFDFPGVPALDKTSIVNLSTFLAAILYTGPRAVRAPQEWWINVLMIGYVASPILTIFGNSDALIYGDLLIPGLKLYDAFSSGAYKAIDLLPLLIGYNLLRTPKGQHEILRAIVIASLGYSLLMLVEIRLSPQLHRWIYGFFPHSFDQQMRGDGFRPVVFLGHGLLVAIFAAISIAAAAYLARMRVRLFGISSWWWLAYLLIVLMLCKSLGALILAVAAAGMTLFMNRKLIRIICASAALIVLTYPALRGSDSIPVQPIADYVAHYSEERAASFQTRIDNEDQLLARANQRPWFGWGGYGRNRVFNEETGKDISITDGMWIIIVGTYGWIGYIFTFGLLCIPIIISSAKKFNYLANSGFVDMLLVINLFDILLNSSLSPLTWLMAGSAVPFIHSARLKRGSFG